MDIRHILEKLQASGFTSAKLSRDGKSVIYGYGDKGFVRIEVGETPIVRNHLTVGRAVARHYLSCISDALAK